ncbi:hypothetical protein B9Z19DRAFT_1078424 [Tuber borchii]|uniref:Uncharacterized protein n=1 Tax=Tuber borchii TaxID=42251 RepID=A0A2T6ZZF3_TUBBO|nr:hypothetical protein B9Z19DRAFT_1078424 [Tuber borchii]
MPRFSDHPISVMPSLPTALPLTHIASLPNHSALSLSTPPTISFTARTTKYQ